MTQYVTMTQLASTCGISRSVLVRRLIRAGLCIDAHTPTESAIAKGLCRTQPALGGNVLVLWHREQTAVAFADAQNPPPHRRDAKEPARCAIRNAIAAARQVMQWGEIVELVIEMKAEEQGIHARAV